MSTPPRIRAERFGAIVRTEDPPALVSVDRELARRLGAEGGALWADPSPGLGVDALTAPTEVHLAVTERCPAGCTGCYADARPEGHEPTHEELRARLRTLAEEGVFYVAFGGGEGALRADVGEVAAYARQVGMVPTLTTSGLGITPRTVERFTSFAQVNVSYDGPSPVYRAVRGYDGVPVAERALRLLREAGIPTGVNVVVTKQTFEHLATVAERADELGAEELQLVRFKPSGRGRLDYLARRLSEAQVCAFPERVRGLVKSYRVGVRIDCALVPFLVGTGEVDPAELSRFGVQGCEPGRSLMTVRADGTVAPCSFWGEPGGVALSAEAWRDDPVLGAFRHYAAALPEPCASCAYRAACRGGCRIVAGHEAPRTEPESLEGVVSPPSPPLQAEAAAAFRPDPECPRVRAHLRSRGAEPG
jgi:radical SAM protein with 4Fe4S-binding SPASM domain